MNIAEQTCKTTNNNGPQNISKLDTVFCFGASRDLKIISYKRNLVVFLIKTFEKPYGLHGAWSRDKASSYPGDLFYLLFIDLIKGLTLYA